MAVASFSFPVLKSALDLRQSEYEDNRKSWAALLEKFDHALSQTSIEGSPEATARHMERGQLLARDRVSLVLDQDSPFLELGAFMGYNLKDSSPCASIIGGIGNVCGRPVMILAHVPTQSGGAWNEFTVIKQNRVTEIATENGLPIVALVQSAGVFLPQQFRVFHKGGQIFRDLAIRTQKGLKSCAVVFGSSTAGGAYHPALSDYTVFVKSQAQVFLGGPPLVKMATGEIIGAEELGGADVHATVTGLADQIVVDEFEAIRSAREWVATLPTGDQMPMRMAEPAKPRYPASDLLAIVNPDIRKPFDMSEALLRIVDDSRLLKFKPSFGRNLVTTWAHIHGFQVGIVANQTPVINADEASKGAQFIRMCNQQYVVDWDPIPPSPKFGQKGTDTETHHRNVPIVFLHNVTGFMVGSKAEHAAIIKRGAQMVSAVSCSTVPHLSVILGASYGAGNYAMCGRAYRPRFLFAWPSGRCSVMGPDQLAGVMETIKRAGARAPPDEAELAASVRAFRDGVERDSECYSTSAVGLDDGIIDPRDTRDVLGMCLEVVSREGIRGTESHSTLARM